MGHLEWLWWIRKFGILWTIILCYRMRQNMWSLQEEVRGIPWKRTQRTPLDSMEGYGTRNTEKMIRRGIPKNLNFDDKFQLLGSRRGLAHTLLQCNCCQNCDLTTCRNSSSTWNSV